MPTRTPRAAARRRRRRGRPWLRGRHRPRTARAGRRRQRPIPVRCCARSRGCARNAHRHGALCLCALRLPHRARWQMSAWRNPRGQRRWTGWRWTISAAQPPLRPRPQGRRRRSALNSWGVPDGGSGRSSMPRTGFVQSGRPCKNTTCDRPEVRRSTSWPLQKAHESFLLRVRTPCSENACPKIKEWSSRHDQTNP